LCFICFLFKLAFGKGQKIQKYFFSFFNAVVKNLSGYTIVAVVASSLS